jgi:colanic acid/amylovoran biosynthesis protein
MLPPKAVGLTARQWLPDHAQHRYELALARTIDQLTARGFRPVLVPQVTAAYTADDDRIVERRIADLCATAPTRLDEQLPYDVLFRLYGECEFFVGTRFHSVIFALLHRVPCLAIEYEHKTSGIMNDLGLGEWSIPIEDATDERVSALADRLIASRDSYLAQLDAVLPDYVARSRLFVHQLRETVSTREADQLAV